MISRRLWQDGNGNYLTFDNFSYFAVDGVTGVSSSSNATVSYSVKPMNDPPVSRSFRTYISAGVVTVVDFNSSDVDNSRSFKKAYITK